MMNSYDEDLKANPFYKALLEYQDDLENASRKDWIICIPRKGTVQAPITKLDIYNHILVPNSSKTCFTTLNNLVIHIVNNKLEIEDRDDYFNTIRILFNETFYHRQLKYKVYCIEFPLSRHFVLANPINQIGNLRDCIDFLWIETYGRDVFQKITKVCQLYLAKHELAKNSSLDAMKRSLERFYQKCLGIPSECSRLEEKIKSDVILHYNLKVATETFMQHSLNNYIFITICAIQSHHDANFNKITRNLQEIQMKHFEISRYQELISSARCELKKINNYITTLGKIQCLKATFAILSSCNGRNRRESEILNADDLVQLFAFLIIKLNVNNWIANLVYMKEFMFSHTDKQDEGDYLITTLEAAIEFIKGASLFDKINSDIDCSQNNIIIEIRNCNLARLKEIFPEENLEFNNKQKLENNQNLCHPLCSCDRCEQVLTQTRKNLQTCFDYVDEKGRTCLHVACMYGFSQIVDFLLHKGIPCNVADYSGSYPLHYTALRGHLNPLLLLLHLGADLNATNADANTALHLAAGNGHENCVKGLLYYSEHQANILNVNWCNAWGETALHLAAKWGYMNIVNILLEYQLDVRVRNKRNETAMDVAHSAKIKTIISNFIQAGGGLTAADTNGCHLHARDARDFACDSEDVKLYGVRPKNFEQFKRADLLLKAIENNDLPLSCFYLGIPVSPIVNNNGNTPPAGPPANSHKSRTNISSFHCHPLCDCPLCVTTKSSSLAPNSQQSKLNINICNSEGFTPLHVAAQFGRNEILRLLLDAGADCNLQTYKAFYSPLHLGCLNQRVLVIKELLLSGSCNLDLQDGKGNTALHYACRKNDLRILDLILSKGADSSIKNNNGKTVLRLAQEKSLFTVMKIIKEKTRDIHSSYEELL